MKTQRSSGKSAALFQTPSFPYNARAFQKNITLQIGIVGLPNVGKSTLFNALTRSQAAQAANFPFCTIDPNVGVVNVPDERLERISAVVHPQKIVMSTVEFVDIAGLVKGASEGEGLGNQFLAHIRECAALAMVLRFFSDENVHHVHGKVDPRNDREVIETELILADLQTLEKNVARAEKEKRGGDKAAAIKYEVCQRLIEHLQQGNRANTLKFVEDEKSALRELHLLTAKPFLYLANIAENEIQMFDIAMAKKIAGLEENDALIPVSAQVEADLVDFDGAEAAELLTSLGLKESGLSLLIRTAYGKLGLRSFFTAGEKETRAWTFREGALAPECAGVIHSDFEKHFIKADVVHWDDFISHEGWAGCREKGLVRSEGKEYPMKDGDVCLFKTSA